MEPKYNSLYEVPKAELLEEAVRLGLTIPEGATKREIQKMFRELYKKKEALALLEVLQASRK